MTVPETMGIYVSVPFCASKCSFCNFSSDVFPQGSVKNYVGRLCDEINEAGSVARRLGLAVPGVVDTLYLGGGTPGMLEAAFFARVADALRARFCFADAVEWTVECAPGQLSAETLAAMVQAGVNRISIGVQSFVDAETRAVGRLHSRRQTLEAIRMVRAAGICDISLDLIAGLPLQTPQSWQHSLDCLLEADAPHASIYMLEVDEGSRLGREVLNGGARFYADRVPSDDASAEMYEAACEQLQRAELQQYEISNFARAGRESRHNLRYWAREPYLGFGLDAHSMLRNAAGSCARFSNPDRMEDYISGNARAKIETLDAAEELEEFFFLGLRRTAGVSFRGAQETFGASLVAPLLPMLTDLVSTGLLATDGEIYRLTGKGRMLSNEVFSRLIDVLPEPAYA